MPNRLTPLDFSTPAIELKVGLFTTRWEQLLRALFGDVASVSSLPAVVNRFAFAAQPSLGASDEGYIAFETTYGHLLRWTGAVWEFAPGDLGNGFRRDFAIVPQEIGWKLCDGTLTDYLTVGAAALTVTAFTPPNLSGSPAFHKSSALYTGTIEAAIGGGLTGATANEAAHTHDDGTLATGDPDGSTPNLLSPGAFFFAASDLHHHNITGNTGAGTAHSHGAGTLATDTAARPPSVGWLPYFRR